MANGHDRHHWATRETTTHRATSVACHCSPDKSINADTKADTNADTDADTTADTKIPIPAPRPIPLHMHSSAPLPR